MDGRRPRLAEGSISVREERGGRRALVIPRLRASRRDLSREGTPRLERGARKVESLDAALASAENVSSAESL